MKNIFLLCFLLSGCAAAINAERGTTRGATCTVQYQAIINVPKTAWGESSTFYGGYPYPSKQLVGWDWCFVPKGEQVRILGAGDIGLNETVNVVALKKGCAGSLAIAALDQCSGGDSFTELVFPFTKPAPILNVY